MDVFDLVPPTAAEVPLLVSIPHTGTHVPPDIRARLLEPHGSLLPDTDFHLHHLYDFAPALGAWTLSARMSRYVVDLNRPRDGAPLYPGRSETGLVPVNTFANQPLYAPGDEPSANEAARRAELYWDPYHAEIRRVLDGLKERHGYALLWEAHSITSVVPRFWPEPLPGLMLGDADGTTADAALGHAVFDVLEGSGMGARRNVPFKGGYITRAFGKPALGVHALQLEMSQRLYMEERPPFAWDPARAAPLAHVLRRALSAFIAAGRNAQPH